MGRWAETGLHPHVEFLPLLGGSQDLQPTFIHTDLTWRCDRYQDAIPPTGDSLSDDIPNKIHWCFAPKNGPLDSRRKAARHGSPLPASGVRLQGLAARLAGPHSNAISHRIDEELPVTDIFGPNLLDDGVNGDLSIGIVNHQLQLHAYLLDRFLPL